MEMARSMLEAKNISNEFWVEAVACVVYILNRSPTKSVKNTIPQDAWNSRKHNVSHFRVFLCVSYSLVPSEVRKKLDIKVKMYLYWL